MRILCEVEWTTVAASNGRMIDGVLVVCGRCGETSEACGTSRASVKFALVQLRDICSGSACAGAFYDANWPDWCE